MGSYGSTTGSLTRGVLGAVLLLVSSSNDQIRIRAEAGRAGVSTIGRIDNSLWQSDRLKMAIALTVRLGSFDTLPMAGTCRGDSERDGLGARQRTCASGRWTPLELHILRAEVGNAELHCA